MSGWLGPGQGHEGTFQGDGNSLYLDYCGRCTGISIDNSLNSSCKMGTCTVCKFDLNKVDFKHNSFPRVWMRGLKPPSCQKWPQDCGLLLGS